MPSILHSNRRFPGTKTQLRAGSRVTASFAARFGFLPASGAKRQGTARKTLPFPDRSSWKSVQFCFDGWSSSDLTMTGVNAAGPWQTVTKVPAARLPDPRLRIRDVSTRCAVAFLTCLAGHLAGVSLRIETTTYFLLGPATLLAGLLARRAGLPIRIESHRHRTRPATFALRSARHEVAPAAAGPSFAPVA